MVMSKRHQSATARAKSRGGTADAGFSLLEVVVSFGLFAIVAGGAMYGIDNALTASHQSQQRIDAANVAQRFIAQAITDAVTVAPEQGRTVISNVGDGTHAASEQFTVIRWITFGGGSSTCHPGTTFTVNIEVKQAQSGVGLARSDTSIACPPV